MTHLLTDIRFALRSFAKAPVFTLVAVTSLALGIGANTAIFTLMDQVLLRALPVKDPEQLVRIFANGPHYGSNWGSNSMSHPMYLDFRATIKCSAMLSAGSGQPPASVITARLSASVVSWCRATTSTCWE